MKTILNICFLLTLIGSSMAQCAFEFEAFTGGSTAAAGCEWQFEAFNGAATATCAWEFERFNGLDVTIRGYIKDAAKGSLIPDATLTSGGIVIKFAASGVEYTATILAGGIYQITLPSGTYTRTATLSGYVTSSGSVTVSAGSTESNAANTVSLTQNNPNYTLRGYIKDGATGNLIDNSVLTSKGLTIVFTSSTGQTYTASIVAGSIYSVSLPKGTYTRTAKLTGYSSGTDTIEVTGDSAESVNANTVYLVASVNGWRIVVTWGSKVKDIDAYVVLPDKSTKIYYKSKTSSDGKVILDIDNRTGFGPETVTIKNVSTGTYAYWVNDYSKEVGLSDSEAKVVVYHGDSQAGSFTVPTGSGSNLWWHVCDVDAAANKLITVNKFGTAIA